MSRRRTWRAPSAFRIMSDECFVHVVETFVVGLPDDVLTECEGE